MSSSSSIKKLRRLKEKSLGGSSNEAAQRDILLELSQELLSEGRLEEALREFEELALLSQGTELEAFAYRKAGEVLEKMGDYRAAEVKLKTYFEVSLGNPIELQRALTTLGGHYLAKAEYSVYDEESRFTMDSPEISADLIKASDFSKRAESAIKDILDPSVSIREKEEMRCAIYANRFKIAHFRGRTENSLEYFARGERLMMENKFSERLSSLYASRSFLEHKAGNLESALSYIENAIKITSGASKDLVLRDKALILLDLRCFNKAQLLCIEAYKSVPKASREVFKALLQSVTKILNILDTESQCEVEKLERLGDECSKVDAFRAAIWYYDNAVTRWKAGPQNDYKRLSGLLTSLAMTYKDLKMFDIASEYYQKELRISQTYPEEAFKTLMALCVTSDLGGKPLDVLKPLYTEAWKLTKDLKDERKEMHCLKEFIDFYDRRGENDGFLEQLRESLSSLLSDNGMSIEDIGPEVEESQENSDSEEFDVDELIYRMDASDKRSKRKVNLKKDMKGETELHRKVKNPGHKREVARLIETCVFVDLEDNANYTPLHEASNHGQLEYVKMLIAAGADVNKVSESGTSPLISAAVNGHMDVMEYLLDQGAKPYHQDSDGWSALDYFKDADLSSEDEPYKRLYSRLSRAIETRVATGLRLEPKRKAASSALIVVCQDDEGPDEGGRVEKSCHSALRSMKVNEKITKYGERNPVRKNDFNDTKSASNSKATSEYRKTMASLGSSGSTGSGFPSIKSKAEKIYSKSVISEREYDYVNALDTEEWLEDDICAKRKKAKRPESEPYSIKKVRRYVEDEEDSPPKKRMSLPPQQQTATVPPNRHKQPEPPKQPPLKALNGGRPSSMKDFFKTAIDVPKAVPSTHSNPVGVLRIKVKVYEKIFLIPILNKNRSAEWLANEASKRYHNATGQRLLLKLTTQDGAEIYPADPLNSIIASSMDTFNAVRTSLNSSVPLEKFYAKRCKELKRNMHKPLLTALSSAIKSGAFILPEKIPFDHSDMEPVLESLSYGLAGRLKELSIPYNSLSELNFMSSFFGLSGLKTLNLSKCGLLGHNLTGEVLPAFPSLEELNLSQNNLGDEAMSKILSKYSSVSILNISQCGLSKRFSLPSEIGDNIRQLNISRNSLGRTGLQDLLSGLNPSKLTALDISHSGSLDSIQEALEILCEHNKCPLEHLNVSGLDFKQTLSDFEVLDVVPQLKSMSLSGNNSLIIRELERLLEGLYARNIPLEQFEASDLFSLYCYEEPGEYASFVSIFKRLMSTQCLVSFRLHMDEEDLLSSIIEELSQAWKSLHGPHSSVECQNQVLSFGHPIY